MNMNQRIMLSTYYRIANENEKTRNMINDLASRKIDEIQHEIKDLQEILKQYKLLKQDISNINYSDNASL